MSAPSPDAANAEQVRYWNEQAGPKWVAQQALLDAQLAHLGERAMDRAGIAAGDAILDVGCGCGATSLELAGRTGETGSVLGVDVSAPMLEVARRRAADAGLRNVRFELADAQTHPLPLASQDVVFSRFGVMFFADPVAAFANLRRTLEPGGRLSFVCWQALALNPWIALPLGVVAQHVELQPPPPPGAPGPFAFADADHVRGILERAGFAAIAVEAFDTTITVGATTDLDGAVSFLLNFGPAASVLAQTDAATRGRVATAVRDAIAPYHGADGVVLDAAAWIATARYSR